MEPEPEPYVIPMDEHPEIEGNGISMQRVPLMQNAQANPYVEAVPSSNFNPPYPIEEAPDVTIIILNKRACCNKIIFSLIINICFLGLFLYFAVQIFVWGQFLDGGWIGEIIFVLASIMMFLAMAKSLSVLFQFTRTELHINKVNKTIEIYEPKIRHFYGNQANDFGCVGMCGCTRKPKITTICYIADFDQAIFDQNSKTVNLRFTDMYNGRTNQYYTIEESGKYGDFAACRYLDDLIRRNVQT